MPWGCHSCIHPKLYPCVLQFWTELGCKKESLVILLKVCCQLWWQPLNYCCPNWDFCINSGVRTDTGTKTASSEVPAVIAEGSKASRKVQSSEIHGETSGRSWKTAGLPYTGVLESWTATGSGWRLACVVRLMTRLTFLPDRCSPSGARDGDYGWFSCLKNAWMLPPLVWNFIYSLVKSARSFSNTPRLIFILERAVSEL